MNRTSVGYRVATALLAVAGGLAVALVLVWVTGHDPVTAASALVRGAFGGRVGIRETLRQTIPLLLAGLGVAVGLRTGLFNVGGEGQIYLGALAATIVGARFGGWPPIVGATATLLAGAVAGGVLGAVAGWLRARLSMNEVLTTILLNLIAFLLVSWTVHGPLRDREGGGYPWSEPVPVAVRIPVARIGGYEIPLGFALALVIAVGVALLFRRTALGLELRTIGDAPETAAFVGIPVANRVVQAFAISGALCGLGGAVELSGSQYRLSDFFSPGYGFTAVAVALVAAGGAGGVTLAALFFGGLRAGSASMERVAGVPSAIVLIVQGLVIVLLVVGRSGWVSRRLVSRVQLEDGG